MKLSLCRGVSSYNNILISPRVVLIRTVVLVLLPGVLQEIKRNINEKAIVLVIMDLFMNIGFWLITFCNSEGKDI